MSKETSITVAEVCDRIGRKEIARSLNVRVTAVSNAVKDNCFPSKWYLIVTDLARAAETECPDGLFAFIRPGNPETPPAEPVATATEHQKGAA